MTTTTADPRFITVFTDVPLRIRRMTRRHAAEAFELLADHCGTTQVLVSSDSFEKATQVCVSCTAFPALEQEVEPDTQIDGWLLRVTLKTGHLGMSTWIAPGNMEAARPYILAVAAHLPALHEAYSR